VLALEKDRRAVEFLRGAYGGLLPPGDGARLEVLEGDALEVDLEAALRSRPESAWVLVSNLPYNVGTAIVLRLLALEAPVSRMVLMFQREVALRLVAAPGSRDYGSLSLAVQARCEARLLFDVPPESFSPPPAVTSSVTLLTPRVHPEVPVALLGRFEEVARAAFAARRKTIQNSLSRHLPVKARAATGALLEAAGIEPGERAEAVDLSRYARLARAVEALLG
jgi:16S rRNA (adenine1518-N6/adenine1519-N6)-dimethyltransferase